MICGQSCYKKPQLQFLVVVSAILCMAMMFLSSCSPNKPVGEGLKEQLDSATSAVIAPKSDEEPLKLGFVPLIDNDKLVESVKPLEEMLSAELKRPVEAFVASSYVGIVHALDSGQIDMAYIPPLAYVLAHEESGVRPGLVALSKDGKRSYSSEILVAADSNIQSLEDLKGKRVAFVDPSSTSGYLFPGALLKQAGIDLENDISVVFSGGHDKSLQLLLAGDVDAIATFANAPTRYKKDFPEALEKLRVLEKTEDIPGITLVFSSKVDAELEGKIKNAFITCQGNAQGKIKFAELFNIHGFSPAKDADYEPVRETAKLMDIDLSALK